MGIVFCGELFEPQGMVERLRRDGHAVPEGEVDAAIALRAVAAYGPACVAELAGAYVGFVYDARTHGGYLFTDRLGLRPCYYRAADDGTLVFASEAKAVAAAGGFKGTLDVQGAAELLNGGHPFFERTLWREIRSLPNGSVLTLRGGAVTLERYWDLDHSQLATWTFEEAVEEGTRRLVAAVGRVCRQSGRIGVLLSGGKDSRAITAAAVAGGRRLPTFTLTDGRSLDASLAARVAERLGLENRQIPVTPDHLVDHGARAMWLTDAMVACRELYWLGPLGAMVPHVDAVMSGYAGDVLLGGDFPIAEDVQDFPLEREREIVARREVPAFEPALGAALAAPFGESLRGTLEETRRGVAAMVNGGGILDERERLYLASHGRRGTNAALGVLASTFCAVKYPFGDYAMIDYCARLRREWRFMQRVYVVIVARGFPGLLDIPTVAPRTQGIPRRIGAEPGRWHMAWRRWMQRARFRLRQVSGGRWGWWRDPSKFTHDAYWYRTVPRLRGWIEDVLLSERTLDRGYFDREGVRRVLDLQMRCGYHFDLISRLVTFEFWNRFFVDGERPPQAEEA